MPIIASSGGNKDFEQCPTGLQRSVCVFVEDLGMQETQYGNKHRVCIVWEVESKRTDGFGFLMCRDYTLSLNEKSTLRKDLEQWRGRAFKEEELAAFDLEKLRGAPGLINVIEYTKQDGKPGRKVGAIMPLQKGQQPLVATTTIKPDWLLKKKGITPVGSFMNDTPSTPVGDVTPPVEDDLPF